jgi:hypothetical protein
MIGWLKHYQGKNYKDEYPLPFGGGKWNSANFGWEGNNFLPKADNNGILHCYGFPNKGNNLHVERRFTGREENGFIEDILVIWLANPCDDGYRINCDFRGKGTRIVGWYNHATAYKSYDLAQKLGAAHECYFSAETKNCILVPEDERQFVYDKLLRSVRYVRLNEIDIECPTRKCVDYILDYERNMKQGR